MYLKSLFPVPPPVHDVNIHHVFFNRPDQSQWPEVIIHIDIDTGRKRTFKELKERVNDAYAAFGSPLQDGGMGFGGEGTTEMIGILSENCSVVFYLSSHPQRPS